MTCFDLALSICAIVGLSLTHPAWAQDKKPKIVLIVSNEFGYGDAGVYGGGLGRGMPTPQLDRMAEERHLDD